MRQFHRWWGYRKEGQGTLNASIPWLVFGAIDFLQNWLDETKQVFEYGSGGSTVFFAEKVHQIVSIEHDADWYSLVAAHIYQKKLSNVIYILREPLPDAQYNQRTASNPDDFVSGRTSYHGLGFKEYASSIDHYGSFDLIVIDGRVRTACIKKALPHLNKNGLLLLDNAERTYYLEPFPELKDKSKWEAILFEGHFPFSPASVVNQTALFKKLYS